MKRTFRLLAVLLAWLLLLSGGAVALAADDEDTVEFLAEAIAAAVEADEDAVAFYPDDIGQDWDNMDTLLGEAMDEVRYQRPELSWKLTSEWSYISDGSFITVRPEYAADSDTLRQMQAELEAQTEAVLQVLSEQEDEWHELLALHDWLCGNVTYGTNDYAQSIYGALVLHECVCAGFSAAFAYFLDLLGVENRNIIGSAMNDQGEINTHSWNRVTEDGRDYYVDVTWDNTDQYAADTELILHDYFMVSAGTLAYHFPDDADAMLITDEDDGEGPWNYHVHEGCYLESFNYDVVCGILAQQAAEGENVLTVRLADAQAYMQSEDELDGGNLLVNLVAALGYRTCTWFEVNPESDEVFAWNIVPE